jgi:hypothetical protein
MASAAVATTHAYATHATTVVDTDILGSNCYPGAEWNRDPGTSHHFHDR